MVCACVALSFAPSKVQAQPTGQPGATQQVVALLPFRGSATQDLLDDADAAVRSALQSRGVRVFDRTAVNAMLGVDAPRDAQNVAGFGRNMGATHVISATVQPLSGQYNLTLVLTEVATARTATQSANIGDDNHQQAIGEMLRALFDPAALGPPPVDPEEERRRLEAERQRAEAERLRQEALQQSEAERRRREQANQQQQWERDHPTRSYAAGGDFALGVTLQPGVLLSETRAVPAGTTLSSPSSFALGLRAEGAYVLRAVAGLEVLGALLLTTTPTTALGIGGGAQFTFPSESRGHWRATAGATLGLFQGLSGARSTTVWVSAYARAQYELSSTLALIAGVSLDIAPGGNGGITALSATVGARVRIGN
jgi:hypothetical protein